jgi:hypothetical protein
MLQKPRMPSKPAAMPQIRVGERMFTLNERRAGARRVGKGEAVLRYCEPLPIPPKAGRHHTAFPKGKKQGQFLLFQDFTFCELPKNNLF